MPVVIIDNPFQSKQKLFEIEKATNIYSYANKFKIKSYPMICLMNGQAVLAKDWQRTKLKKQDFVAFIALPMGGGGGGGKILRTVLTIAVIAAAPFAGAALASSLGITSAIGVAFLTAGIAIAGSVLVNILIPPPVASSFNPGSGFGNVPTPSPTYSLQSQGNQARLSQPVPVIYGRHIIYPDLANAPYTEYDNNQQYLYQLYCIGQGEYEVEAIRIEDTPIESFAEITIQHIPPLNQLTLFAHHVITAPEVAGQEMLAAGDGGGYLGPFIANPAGTKAASIGIDIFMPRGLYYANNDGNLNDKTTSWQVEARLIDNESNSIHEWKILGSETCTAASNTPISKSYKYTVMQGRYEIRVIRLDNKDKSWRAGHEIRLGALRAYLESKQDFGNVTLLAVKMRATDNLSQRSSRLLNCIVKRKLPVWEPDQGWSSKPTRSIAWALADICTSSYGAGLPDNRLDLQALYALNQEWESRGDYFDGVFDQGTTVWEALSKVARCGRAVAFIQGGAIRFVRDKLKTIPVTLFSPRNIVKNSLKVQYILASDDNADSVTVEYFSAKTWKPDEITVSLPDSSCKQSAKVRLFGCTNELQARREGLYIAAAHRYRRKVITFRTELEGLIPTYGDLIAIAHDMLSLGQGGEVIAIHGDVLTLSEPLAWKNKGNEIQEKHYIALRKKNGSVSGPWQVKAGRGDNQVIIEEAIDLTPYTGTQAERTLFSFGAEEKWSTLARVTDIRSRGSQVEISAVAEHTQVHTADIIKN